MSCGIDCGSLERFEVKVTFRIINALNFLDSASAGILEKTSVEYLSNYVENLKPASKFFLYEAELTAQQIQAPNRAGGDSANRNLRRTQVVESQYNDLIVTLAFRGLAIVLGNAVINALIVQGIDSAGYSRAIQSSGDPTFLNIEVTSSVTDDSGASKNSTKTGGGDGPSPGGTAAAVLMAFSFAGIGIGWFVKKRRTETKAKAIVKTQEESEAEIFTGATGSPRSAPVGNVSFESTSGVVAGILRIMSSGSPRSNDSSTHSGQTSNQSSKASLQGSSDGTTSSQSEEEHPYTGLIPPMIVIDNLDEESPSSAKKGGNRNVVPYQRLQASIELVAALNGTSGAYDPSVFQGELCSQSLVAKSFSRSSSDQSRSLSPSPFNRVWDSDAEDGSAGSIVTSSYTKDELDVILNQQQPLDTDAVAVLVGANNGLRVTTDLRPASRGSNRSSRGSPSRHQDSSPLSAASSRGNVSSPERERSFSNASTVIQGQYGEHSGEPPPAPVEKLKEVGGFIQSFWNRSPGKTMPRIMSLASLNGATASDSNSFSHSRHGSKGSLVNDDDESVRHIFWAPRKGKLGLVIECNSSGGPVVVQVKDYSPLLGQVLRGDKIAKIDNVSTLHMTLAEVTNLLGGGGKTSYLRGPVIQFVVLRCPNSSTAAGSFVQENSPSIESMSQGGSFSDMFTSSDSLPTPK
jgi:hypothetical protein